MRIRRSVLVAVWCGVVGLAGAGLLAQPADIFRLVNSGDLEKTRALLAENPRLVTATDPSGRTLLHAAVATRNVEMARLLIEHGVAVRAGDLNLRAPIHLANQLRDTRMMDLLVEKGAPIDTRAIGAATPLIHASLNDDVAMSRYLIEHGADIDVQCNSLTTPLYFAVLNNNIEYFEYLVAAGADIDTPDFLDRTPLHLAVRDGHARLVDRLLALGANPHRSDIRTGRTLLHLAAIEGHDEAIERLLAAGVGLNDLDRGGRTPLDHARAHAHASTVGLLTGKGARGGKPLPAPVAAPLTVGQGQAVLVKLQNGAWGIATAHTFLALGYSEVGAAPTGRALANGHVTPDAVGRDRALVVVDHDFHPASSRRGLDGSNPLHAMQTTHGRVRFILNAVNQGRYTDVALGQASYLQPGEEAAFDGVRCRVFRSYGTNRAYVIEVDGLTIVWLTGICDNYVPTRRDTGVIEALMQASIRPDVLLVGSPSGIGPELANGIRETYREGLRLGPQAVVVFGHEPLEWRVRGQLERRHVDTTPLRTADTPGDRFGVRS